MHVIRYMDPHGPRYGQVEGDVVHELTGAPWLGCAPTLVTLPLSGLELLAPVEPGKLICIGRNYVAHAEELSNIVPDEPLLFLKPPSSVIGPETPIRYPAMTSNLHYEGELAAVIGRRARHVAEAEALDYVFGYTCANDITARDLQQRDNQWTRAKGFDTFCPLGPWVVSGLEPQALQLRTRVNGATRQDATTALQVYSLARLLAYISAIMTLEPGDVILTGTPAGVGPLAVADSVEVEIEGVGVLRNGVVAEETSSLNVER